VDDNADQADDDQDGVGTACDNCPTGPNPRVRVVTNLGAFTIELEAQLAPISSENFLTYVAEGFYDGDDGLDATIFHRVDVPQHVVQGGGYTEALVQKAVHDPIENEADNGLLNVRGTVGMARTAAPDSATAQWYVNTADNPGFNPSGSSAGYAVFGKVVEGMT